MRRAAVKRLEEVIEVLNTGAYATMRAYFKANSVHAVAYNPPTRKTFPWEVPALSQVLDHYRRSRGLDLVRVTTEPSRGDVVGIVRNRLTGMNGRASGQCTDFGELRDTPYTIVVLSKLTMRTSSDVTDRILRALRPS